MKLLGKRCSLFTGVAELLGSPLPRPEESHLEERTAHGAVCGEAEKEKENSYNTVGTPDPVGQNPDLSWGFSFS